MQLRNHHFVLPPHAEHKAYQVFSITVEQTRLVDQTLLFASNALLEAWSVYQDLTENAIPCALLGPDGLIGVFWFSQEVIVELQKLINNQ